MKLSAALMTVKLQTYIFFRNSYCWRLEEGYYKSQFSRDLMLNAMKFRRIALLELAFVQNTADFCHKNFRSKYLHQPGLT